MRLGGGGRESKGGRRGRIRIQLTRGEGKSTQEFNIKLQKILLPEEISLGKGANDEDTRVYMS